MMQNDWRAEYDREVAERDRLMAEVQRRDLMHAYGVLEMANEGWDGEPSLQANGLQRVLKGPCGRFIGSFEAPEYCNEDGWHRIDHAMDAGGIGNPPKGFAARYTGTCANCRGRIIPGQYIRRQGRGFAHAAEA